MQDLFLKIIYVLKKYLCSRALYFIFCKPTITLAHASDIHLRYISVLRAAMHL